MAKDKTKKVDLLFFVENISLIDCEIYPEAQNMDFSSFDDLSYSLTAETLAAEGEGKINITIKYVFAKKDIVFHTITVLSVFNVHTKMPNAIKYASANEKFMKNIIDLNINHTRGIQAYLIKDSKFKHLYIPIRHHLQIVGAKTASNNNPL